MKELTIFFLLIFIAGLLLKCNKNEITSRNYPRLKTLETSVISENGAKFNAEIIFRGNFEIINYGFVWSEMNNPTLDSSDRVVFAEDVQSNKFSAVISSAFKEGATYFVRSFVQTEDYIVYGNIIEFKSLGSKAPEVFSFTPKFGTWGDSILIVGKNFSYLKDNNKVLMGEIASEVVYASDTVLTIIVPSKKNENVVKLSISIFGNSSTSTEDFNYTIPEITYVQPISGTFNDTITIFGKRFSQFEKNNIVKIGKIVPKIIEMSSSKISFIVPEKLETKESEIKLISVGQELVYNKKFILNPPIILSFEPLKISKLNEVITLIGKNFNPNKQFNKVFIGGQEAVIIEATNDMIKVNFPDEVLTPYAISKLFDVHLSVTVAEQMFTAEQMLEIYWRSTWTEKSQFTGSARHNAVAFSIGNKGYFGTGLAEGANNDYQLLGDFWEYDPSSDQWIQIADFPGGPRAGASAFSIGEKGYVGLGSINYYWDSPEKDKDHFSDFYMYDPSNGKWTQITDFKGVGRHSAASFTINNEGYVVTGDWGIDAPYGNSKSANDVWKYDPVSSQWEQMIDFPNRTNGAVGFNIGNTGYIYDYDRLYRYTNDNWLELNSVDLGARDNVGFSVNDKAYLGLGLPHQISGTNLLWEYDPITETSIKKSMDYYSKRWGASVFVINDKAYIVGGATYNNGKVVHRSDVWEFDPNLPNY